MSKKAQTTGVPKRRRRRAQAAADQQSDNLAQGGSDSSFLSRAEREAQLQRRVIRGAIALVAVLALLVAITFAIEQLIVPNQAVAGS